MLTAPPGDPFQPASDSLRGDGPHCLRRYGRQAACLAGRADGMRELTVMDCFIHNLSIPARTVLGVMVKVHSVDAVFQGPPDSAFQEILISWILKKSMLDAHDEVERINES